MHSNWRRFVNWRSEFLAISVGSLKPFPLKMWGALCFCLRRLYGLFHTRMLEVHLRFQVLNWYVGRKLYRLYVCLDWYYPKDPFVCPKEGNSPNQSYSGDGMFRPSILLDWEGSGFFGLPSRKLTYPTWGKGKSSSNIPYHGDMLIPWRVYFSITLQYIATSSFTKPPLGKSRPLNLDFLRPNLGLIIFRSIGVSRHQDHHFFEWGIPITFQFGQIIIPVFFGCKYCWWKKSC